MGVSPLVWGSLLISLSIGDPFLARLDCRRVNLSFCCTSRIKDFCKEQCAGVECGPSFYKGMFNTDGKEESSARDGDTGVAERGTVTVTDFPAPTPSPSAFPTLIPPQSGGQVPVEITPPTPAPTVPLPVTTQSSALSIVDLIDPMAPPAMPPLPNLPSPADSTATVVTPPHASKPRIRVTPDPRIIRPPESLAFISDFDEEDVGNTIDAQVVTNEQRMEVPSQNGPAPPVNSAIHHRSDTSDGTTGSAHSATVEREQKTQRLRGKKKTDDTVLRKREPSEWQKSIWDERSGNSLEDVEDVEDDRETENGHLKTLPATFPNTTDSSPIEKPKLKRIFIGHRMRSLRHH